MIRRELFAISCCYRLGTERMSQVVMTVAAPWSGLATQIAIRIATTTTTLAASMSISGKYSFNMGTLTVPDTDGQFEREPRRDYEPGTQARGCKASTA